MEQPSMIRFTPLGLDADQRQERRQAIDSIRDSVSLRSAQLQELIAQSRERREEVRAQRTKLRSEMQMRRVLMAASSRRAAVAILEASARVAGLGINDLWMEYFALGGHASAGQLSSMLSGQETLSPQDHDRIAMIINERLEQAGLGRPLASWDGSR